MTTHRDATRDAHGARRVASAVPRPRAIGRHRAVPATRGGAAATPRERGLAHDARRRGATRRRVGRLRRGRALGRRARGAKARRETRATIHGRWDDRVRRRHAVRGDDDERGRRRDGARTRDAPAKSDGGDGRGVRAGVR